MHRLAFLSADGQLSAYCRVKTCQDAGRVLTEIRSLGLTRPGGPAAGLADDFTLTAGDVPAKADPVNPAAMSRPRSCARSAAIFPSWKRPSPAGKPGSRSSCSWTPAAGPLRSALVAAS